MFRPTFPSNEQLVDSLVERGYIESGEVEEAFRSVDRKNFVPRELEDEAYSDRPLPISEGATISGPHMVAINTELLDVDKGNLVIEIGSGSGYQLAILSELVGEEGKAVGVEIEEELVRKSRERLSGRENVEVFHGSGFDPFAEDSGLCEDLHSSRNREGFQGFDRILFSCTIDSLEGFLPYLVECGVLVAPVKEENFQVVKRFQGDETSEHERVRFVDFREE